MQLMKASKFASEKLSEFGLTEKGWSFRFDKAKVRFGCCKPRYKHITLSRHLTELNEEDEVIDTILHEIAHALDFEERGTSDHGQNWKKWAVRVGARPTRCYDSSQVTNKGYKYFDYCPSCGKARGKMRKGNARRLQSCGKCGGRSFNMNKLIIKDVPATKIEKVKDGSIDWRTLPQLEALRNRVIDQRGRLVARTNPIVGDAEPKSTNIPEVKPVKIAAKTKAPQKKKGLSNKAFVYKVWKDGVDDADALHVMVGKAVKLTTIKSWLSGWAKGKNLPAIAK